MADEVFCGNCKKKLNEAATADQQQPCADCGSKNRSFSTQMQGFLKLSGQVDAKLTTYPNILLAVAKNLLDQGLFNVAVVTGHMACEVATERALSAGFATKNIPELEEPVEALLNGYNMANEKIRKLYTALTQDQIGQTAFWSEFKASSERRNVIVHRGASVDKPSAEKSLQATTSFVAHLKQ
jgi:hypothetical protein